jgi:hypothetical protein
VRLERIGPGGAGARYAVLARRRARRETSHLEHASFPVEDPGMLRMCDARSPPPTPPPGRPDISGVSQES